MRRLLLLVLVCVAACGDSSSGPTPPKPGALAVRFTTPVLTDRALLLEIDAPAPITTALASSANSSVFARANGNTTRIAVIGTLSTGQVVRFDVPDVNKIKSYTVRILEVSGQDNTLRADLRAYAARVELPR